MSGERAPWERWPAPALTVGATAVAGGVVVAVPQHAVSVGRILVAALAVIAVVRAVVEILCRLDRRPPATTRPPSPFEETTRPGRYRRDVPTSLSRTRAEIGSGVVRADLAPLTSLAARRLRAVAAAALEREGLRIDDPDHEAALRARLSPHAWAAITAERTLRRRNDLPPHPSRTASAIEVATTVHAVLDELERPPSPPGER